MNETKGHCEGAKGSAQKITRFRLTAILYFYNYRKMETKEALPAFAALSQENRLDALRLMVKAGPRGLAAGEIGEALGLAAPSMSFHLKELANAGLVAARKEGRHVFYAADYGGIRKLVDFLMADCCQGDPRLCGPYIIKENSREPFACPPKS